MLQQKHPWYGGKQILCNINTSTHSERLKLKRSVGILHGVSLSRNPENKRKLLKPGRPSLHLVRLRGMNNKHSALWSSCLQVEKSRNSGHLPGSRKWRPKECSETFLSYFYVCTELDEFWWTELTHVISTQIKKQKIINILKPHIMGLSIYYLPLPQRESPSRPLTFNII